MQITNESQYGGSYPFDGMMCQQAWAAVMLSELEFDYSDVNSSIAFASAIARPLYLSLVSYAFDIQQDLAKFV